MVEVKGLQPGIYFDLPESIYHGDTGLSRSDIVNLLDTPFTYWEKSWMNPDRKFKEASDEMEFGKAFHCQMFEPAKFDREYFVFPTDKWDNDRQMVPKENHDKIIAAIKVLRAGKDSNLFLSGGLGEVTIIFDAFGMRFRTRHDYLTPVCSVDFKTTHTLDQGYLKIAFKKYGYDVQMALYRYSRLRFREQFAAGQAHVFGHVDERFFRMFMQSEVNDFVNIMQRTTPPFPFEPLLPEHDTEKSGMDKILDAVGIYQRNWKEFGTKPWEVSDGKLKRFSMMYGIIRNEN